MNKVEFKLGIMLSLAYYIEEVQGNKEGSLNLKELTGSNSITAMEAWIDQKINTLKDISGVHESKAIAAIPANILEKMSNIIMHELVSNYVA